MLSLIAIAKNEAAGIVDFLQHHADLCDEMVIVDTGSTDATAQLAREAGAHIVAHEWNDDFAAARNASLAAATGDWALVLDIDERIARQDFARLRAAAQGTGRCYLMEQWNYYDRTEHQEWQPVSGRYPDEERGQTGFFCVEQFRLLPVTPGLHWTGRVHEDLTAAVREKGFASSRLDVPVHHFGYDDSLQKNKRRNEYYGQLVRRKVEEDPHDWKAGLELAHILIQEDERNDAVPLLERLGAESDNIGIASRARLLLARLYIQDGREAEAAAQLEKSVAENPGWLFNWTAWIQLLLRRGRYTEAEDVLRRAGRRFGETPLLLRHECHLLVSTRRLVEAIPVGRRVTELIPSMPQYAQLADKCEHLARRTGQLG